MVNLRDVCDFSFQSPSLRGSGRFVYQVVLWGSTGYRCFNPLHCGAVVASGEDLRGDIQGCLVSIPFIAGQWSLQCFHHGSRKYLQLVSIPFIAGQWSLHLIGLGDAFLKAKFQSPSLRGSGRFPPSQGEKRMGSFVFQSPSLRGSGRFPEMRWRPGCGFV